MEETKELKDKIKLVLTAYNELMYEFPSLIIGGSVAILAHGYKLPRLPKDLDLIVPFEKDDNILNNSISRLYDEHVIQTRSMSEFEVGFTHNNSQVRIDIGFFKGYKFEDKILQNRGIRVSPLETVLEFKLMYANRFRNGVSIVTPKNQIVSAQKHWDDLKFLQAQGIPYLTDDMFGPRPEECKSPTFKSVNTRYSAPW